MASRLKSLVRRLNRGTRKVLERSAVLCHARTHYEVDLEHYLLQLEETRDGDGGRILSHFGADATRLYAEMNRRLDGMRRGNLNTAVLSGRLVEMLRESWIIGSLEFGLSEIRTGLTLLALLSHDELARIARDISGELRKVSPEELEKHFFEICAGSAEDTAAAAAVAP